MKNLISFFAIVSLFFFASCSKDATLEYQTEVPVSTTTEVLASTIAFPNPIEESAGRSNEVAVTTISAFQTSSELSTNFSSSHDFSDSILENIQTLEFTDAGGNTVTMSFSVNSFSGQNGLLQVSFAKGSNDLTGLELKDNQVIIEDVIME